MRPVQLFNNTKTDLNFPELPALPAGAGEDLRVYHDGLSRWYDDFKRMLRRDRDETLAKINDLE